MANLWLRALRGFFFSGDRIVRLKVQIRLYSLQIHSAGRNALGNWAPRSTDNPLAMVTPPPAHLRMHIPLVLRHALGDMPKKS